MKLCRLTRTALLAAALGGCTVGPRYHPPAVAVPAGWSRIQAKAALDARALAQWWTTFGDPVLARLVARAVAGNLDVRQAIARVREARARRQLARANRFPSLSASGSASHARRSGESSTLYTAGFDASWELDIFGAQRQTEQAAAATLQARVEDVRDALVTLTSEVALNYLDVLVASARLATAEANLRAQAQTFEIATFRYQAGLVTEIDVAQARTNLEQTRATIPNLRTARAQAVHRIAVLLGQPPAALVRELATVGRVPVVPITIAIGVPADVLRRRPDVRAAERALAAQTALVGAAEAERYPQLSLAGTIGLESLSLGDLATAGARVLTAAARLAQPVFDAGRIRQTIAIQSALQEQAALAYQGAVLTALEDVENALVAYVEEQARRDALVTARDAARQAATLAAARYRAGLIDFQVVLDAERSLLSIEDQLAVSEGAVVSNLVRLYKAAGGGWTPVGGR